MENIANRLAKMLIPKLNFDNETVATSPTSPKEPIVECYRSAKFIDNWQIKKMREIFGVKFPVKKIYYYLTESLEETQKLCGSRGAEGKQAGACFDSKDYKIISPAYNSNGSIYLGLVTALFFESNNQNEEPIKYKGQL
ncbi:hypothetical protein HYU23_03955, partial [Candidatus Woesearchaeota archaeon]|nr:hypothetical protein [Candidatus Woesearchaeota archaeon]